MEVKAVHFWVEGGGTVLCHQRERAGMELVACLGVPLLLPIALREEATEESRQLLESPGGAWMDPWTVWGPGSGR